jgi:hypothetical protein
MKLGFIMIKNKVYTMSDITVAINKFGMITSIDVNGVRGESCKNLTESLEAAVALSPDSCEIDHKPEFYQGVDGNIYEVENQKW